MFPAGRTVCTGRPGFLLPRGGPPGSLQALGRFALAPAHGFPVSLSSSRPRSWLLTGVPSAAHHTGSALMGATGSIYPPPRLPPYPRASIMQAAAGPDLLGQQYSRGQSGKKSCRCGQRPWTGQLCCPELLPARPAWHQARPRGPRSAPASLFWHQGVGAGARRNHLGHPPCPGGFWGDLPSLLSPLEAGTRLTLVHSQNLARVVSFVVVLLLDCEI